jgi:hypothetical protein
MGQYYKIFGVLIWFCSVLFIGYLKSTQALDDIALSIVALAGIVTGFGFIGFGEIIRLLEKQLLQSQALYNLFKQIGGEE